jgi:hypothetical protein
MPVICPTRQLAIEASMLAAGYFAWGCFQYFGTRAFERVESLARELLDVVLVRIHRP